jgi:chromosome segregation ATPase
MNWHYHWRTHPAVNKLEQTIDQLRMDNIGLRHQLQTNQAQVGGLKLALHQRLETIDELRARIDQLRAANQRLDAEAERLAEMVRLSP